MLAIRTVRSSTGGLMNRGAAGWVTLAPLLLAGCYTMHPIAVEELRPGMQLRIEMGEMTPLPGAGGGDLVEGRLTRVGRDSLVVAVWQAPRVGAIREARVSGEVERAFHLPNVTGMEERRIARARTGGLVVGVAAVAAIAARMLWRGAGGFLSGDGSSGNGL